MALGLGVQLRSKSVVALLHIEGQLCLCQTHWLNQSEQVELSVVQSLLSRNDIDVNGSTPYFHNSLALTAGWGYLSIVRYLVDCDARLDSVASL